MSNSIVNRKSTIVDMTQGSISRSLIKFAIPVIISDFFQQLYNAVDSVIVGNILGKVALAAVGGTFFITNIFLGGFLGISIGATVSISKYYGAKNKEKLATSVDTTIKLTALLCIIVTAIGVSTVPFFLRMVGTNDDAYPEAKTYLTVYMAGISAQLIYNMLTAMLKAIGNSRWPLYVLISCSLLNIVLDLLFVGPLEMGVAGAALATVIAQALSSIVLWIMLLKTPAFEHPLIRKQHMDKDILLQTAKVGLPFSCQRIVTSFSNTIVVSYINAFGSACMAGWTIYQKLDQFLMGTVMSLSSATTTFVAQNVGAGHMDRIKKGTRVALALTVCMSLFYAACFSIFRYQFVALFNRETDVLDFGAFFLLAMMPAHVFNAIPQVIAGALRGRGNSVTPTIIIIGCYVVLRQIYLHLRWPSFHSYMLVIAAYHFTWVFCVLVIIIYYLYFEKKTAKKA